MPIKEINLPDIGEGVTEGEMVKWLVKVGDMIEADQPIAEMMTDKATVEIPSPVSGKVKELKVQKGDMVPVQSPLIVLEVSKENVPSSSSSPPSPSENKREPTPPSSEASFAKEKVHSEKAENSRKEVFAPEVRQSSIMASPATRKLAREIGVDLSQVKGTGLSGRIKKEDVLKQTGLSAPFSQSALENGKENQPNPLFSSPPSFQTAQTPQRVPLRGIRRKIALQMKKSKSLIPHFTLVEEAVVSKLVQLRQEMRNKAQTQGIKITYLPFVIKALTQTLRQFPIFNASLEEETEEICYKKDYNIGIAVSTENGLMVPNIKNAEQKSLLELAVEIKGLSQQARQGRLTLPQLQNGTFTITNIGSVGGLYASPIINHPEVAILGMYKIQDKPLLRSLPASSGEEEKLSLHSDKVMNFSITCDHRLIDGAVAAEFLKAFVTRIENPSLLLLEMH